MPLPGNDFRAGKVKTYVLTRYRTQRSNGYFIQLPHRGMTPGPTVVDGSLYVSGGFGSKEYYCFDAAKGQLRWAIELDDDGPTAAVVAEGKVVFNTESCTLFTIDAKTGEQIWSWWLGDPLMSTPAVANGMVYTAYPARKPGEMQIQNQVQVQNQTQNPSPYTSSPPTPTWSPTHVLIALDLETGAVQWQRWIDGDILSAPVVEGKELHFTTFPGTMYKFDALSGALQSAHASRATSPPSLVGEAVFVSRRADDDARSVQESISQLNRSTGKVSQQQYTRAAPYLDQQVQTRSLLKATASSHDAGNGFTSGAPANSGWQKAASNVGASNVSTLQAFVGSRILPYQNRNYNVMGDELLCTHPENGKVLWQQKLPGDLSKAGGFLATAPIVAGDKIIIATLQGEIVLFDPRRGKELARYELGEAVRYPPVVSEGRIYVSTMRGRVHCIETGDLSLTGWSTLGGNAAHTNRP
jgi:Ca-activated chloride channel family protein